MARYTIEILAVVISLHVVPSFAQSQSRALKFEKEIGVGWQPDKYGWMSFVSFSPDGTMVASDGPSRPEDVSGDLKLWSFPEGRLIKRLPLKPRSISRDWRYCATDHGVVEMESDRPVIQLRKDVYAVHAFSPDSRYVAELRSPEFHSHIRIVELANGKQVSAFGKSYASAVAMSPDGVTLASGYWDVVVLWNMFTGERLSVLRGFGRFVVSLSFSPDGGFLAAGTDAGRLQIWDVHARSRLAAIDIGYSGVSKPEFSPDGRLIAAGVYGIGTVWLIDVGSGKIVDRQKVSDMGCGSVAFSPDGRFLITPSTGGLIKWPYDRGGTIRVFRVSDQ